ncbi:PREDICTED: receptor-like protein kinase [Nelumbo nucifera]|uniref:Protein kinase domain-containing protein n=2 Tax=Nelumbo nucifera TaxID=4432 RepID=A0A822XSI2_NELNU|nr:PREDICTED: receptor-like protein kinase [Nelumbo nucifera]DAD22121.1 TPA_asm: hypothetical protein HUJ06_023584 [Nelumbo nucifera]
MSRYVHGSSVLLIFSYFTIVLCQLPPTQRKAIANLSTLFNEENQDPCSWKRVTCTKDNRSITHISLSALSLSTSDFPNGVCQIYSLQLLDVSNNLLSSIPQEFLRNCRRLTGLKALNFSSNSLSGILPSFDGFGGLQTLDLSSNSLGGNITSQFDGLIGLRSLNLSKNTFTGFLPTNLGNSMVLEELQLSSNKFIGGIPKKLMDYRNLTLLDLSINKLSGPVTDRIGKLSRLETLLLSDNNLSGVIPENISRMETLRWLGANQNRFSGTIPHGISRYVRQLDLSYNGLNGSIPSDFLSPPNLQFVDLSYNSLEGAIPTNVSHSLTRLRLGSNFLNGSIPSLAGGSLRKLTYLELDNNTLSGAIPPELGSCNSLLLLNLAHNKLIGPFPKELGNLQHLEVLKLQSNSLVGEIPDQFSGLQNLLELNISKNSFFGSIPSVVSSSKRLERFILNDNKFSGSIPDSVGVLEHLLELQLGNNRINGNIPMMQNDHLQTLNLSSNLFEGPIPVTLNRLHGLEVLDLSNNNFSGEIPIYLTHLGSLSKLLLSNNNLSGTCPNFTQPGILLNTTGNKDLITTPTPLNPTNLSPTHTSQTRRNSDTVIIVVAVGSAVVAVGIIGVILILVARRCYRIHYESPIPENQFPFPRVISYHMMTTSVIHRSCIDFSAAMGAVVSPANILLKSRFCTYYRAIMPNGTSYYVKKLNWSGFLSQLGRREMFEEKLEVLGRLRNSNIMIPLAFVLTDNCAYLIYEYFQKETLFNLLHGSSGSFLDWASRYSIAIGVAQGLGYLHSCATPGPILMLDLSTKNILLKCLEPQIGDIELCHVIDPSNSMGSLSTDNCSVGYIPPEYAYTKRVTMPGNVYNFGVVLLELLTGKPAVNEGIELARWVLSNSTQRETWDKILDPNISKTSARVRGQMLSVLKIALACISVSPEVRPNMKNVQKMLFNAKCR